MAIQVTLECGHASVLRVRTTPEGYTHDWEVFVRGVDSADISQFVDKVIFHLHETFPKPKRILKESPYMVKESGYAGFVIPVDVYFKNKDEPKRIQILYDLHLQQSGPAINNVIRHHQIFVNPSDEFRKKLLKGGGVVVSNPEDSADRGEFKMVPPMVSKPKLSGADAKKHRLTEMRTSDSFADLFGNPIITAKVSPDTKKSVSEKISYPKVPPDKMEKTEKTSKLRHSPHKDRKREKNTDERTEKKEKLVVRDKDRSKEKTKRPVSPGNKEDMPFPASKKNALPSPAKKQLVPPLPTMGQKSPSPKPKEREHKKVLSDKEKDRVKDNFKVPMEERKFDRKRKKHKEEKSKDRKDKEQDRVRECAKKGDKKIDKTEKIEKMERERSLERKVSKDGKKSPKLTKDREKARGLEKPERSEVLDGRGKDSCRIEKEKQRHKHKRKDKRDRVTDNTTEKVKQEKTRILGEKKGSCAASPSANPLSTLLAEMPERDSSDSAHSLEDETILLSKSSLSAIKNDPVETISSPVLCSVTSKSVAPDEIVHPKGENEVKIRTEKSKFMRSADRECRKRKRKFDNGQDESVLVKRDREERGRSASPSAEPVSSSQSPISVDVDSSSYNVKEAPTLHNREKTEGEQVAPDSTNSTLAEPESIEGAALVFSEDYVLQLKELQQKIMTLQDNQELQRVVQVIAETGQYEITKKTFDFDLCALDRTTVQRLQKFFSAS